MCLFRRLAAAFEEEEEGRREEKTFIGNYGVGVEGETTFYPKQLPHLPRRRKRKEEDISACVVSVFQPPSLSLLSVWGRQCLCALGGGSFSAFLSLEALSTFYSPNSSSMCLCI